MPEAGRPGLPSRKGVTSPRPGAAMLSLTLLPGRWQPLPICTSPGESRGSALAALSPYAGTGSLLPLSPYHQPTAPLKQDVVHNDLLPGSKVCNRPMSQNDSAKSSWQCYKTWFSLETLDCPSHCPTLFLPASHLHGPGRFCSPSISPFLPAR